MFMRKVIEIETNEGYFNLCKYSSRNIFFSSYDKCSSIRTHNKRSQSSSSNGQFERFFSLFETVYHTEMAQRVSLRRRIRRIQLSS